MLDDNQGSTYPSPITSYVYSFLMMIDVDTNKLIDFPGSSKFSELGYETTGESCETDYQTIQVNNERSGAIDFCSC